MRLHADVPVRLADGITIEVKHVREGDRLATADAGASPSPRSTARWSATRAG